MLGALASSQIRRNVVFLFFLSTGLSIAGLLVWELVRAPVRTPLVILSATYQAPLDINPWAAENLSQFARLDGRNCTLRKEESVSSLPENVGDFGKTISQCLPADTETPLLIYVNLHAAVDSAGEPCFITPSSGKLTDTKDWIQVSSLLLEVCKHTANRPVVLCFESARLSGLSRQLAQSDQFATALEQLLSSPQFDALSICALGVSQTPSSNDWTGRGDCFSRLVASGLAGEADAVGTAGTKDGFVSLEELVRYVHEELSVWQKANFANDVQICHLQTKALKSRNKTVSLCWSLPSVPPIKRVDPLPPPATKKKVATYWKQLGAITQKSPWRDFPGHLASLNAELVAYESSVFGGTAVRNDKRYEKRFREHLGWLNQRLKEVESANLLESMYQSRQHAWNSLADSPKLNTARALVSGWANSELAVPFIDALYRDDKNPHWAETKELAQFARIQAELSQALLPASSFDGSADKRDSLKKLSESALQIEDIILAGGNSNELGERIAKYELAVESFRRKVNAVQARDESTRATLELLPALVSNLANLGQDTAGNSKDQVFKWIRHLAQELELAGLGENNELQEHLAWVPTIPGLNNVIRLQHAVLEQQSSKFAVASIPNQQQVLDSVLKAPTLPLLSSGGNSSELGDLRLSARQRLLRNAHKLLSSNLRINTNTPVHQSGPNKLTSPLSAAELTLFWNRWIGVLAEEQGAQCDETSTWSQVRRETLRLTNQEDIAGALTKLDSGTLSEQVRKARLLAGLTQAPVGTVLRSLVSDRRAYVEAVNASERSIESFWAIPSVDRLPFFAAQSRNLLAAAQHEFARNTDSSDAKQLRFGDRRARLKERIDELLEFKDKLYSLQYDWHPKLPLQALSLDHSPDTTFRPAWEGSIKIGSGEMAKPPVGLASLRFGDANKRIAVDLKNAGPTRIAVPSAVSDSASTATPKPVMHFRGHQFGANGRASRPRMLVSESVRRRSGKTSITVKDFNQNSRDRTFILDCSSSMIEPASNEVAAANLGGNPLVGSKLEAAKVALLRLLKGLVGTSDRVSVILYGHRVADGTAQQGTLRQTRYDAHFPFATNLIAAEDVETILPLGRFDYAQYLQIEKRLQAVVPWGQTPLYLAIRQAIEQNLQATTSQDIIIISDGRNYQFNPSKDKHPSLDDITKLAQESNSRLHLVGFGVPKQEQKQTSDDYAELAKQSDGTYTTDIFAASELLVHLRKLLEPQSVRINNVAGLQLSGLANESIDITSLVSDRNARLRVQYRDRSFEVFASPGDAKVLRIGVDGKMSVPLYREHSPTFEHIAEGGDLAESQIGVHRPVRVDNDLMWTLSLQSTQGQSIARPQNMIVRITPSSGSHTSTSQANVVSYAFSGEIFETGFSCPVLKMRTCEWPATADAATIEVWINSPGDAINWIPLSTIKTSRRNTGIANDKEVTCQVWGNEVSVLFAQTGNTRSNQPMPLLVPQIDKGPLNLTRSIQTGSIDCCLLNLKFDKDLSAEELDRVSVGLRSISDLSAESQQLRKPIVISLNHSEESVAAKPRHRFIATH